jgi:WD40 repeat protein
MKILFLLLLFQVSMFGYAQTQEPSLVLPVGHTSAITKYSFSSDNRYLATFSKDWDIVIWEVESQKVVNRININDGGFYDFNEIRPVEFLFLNSNDHFAFLQSGSDKSGNYFSISKLSLKNSSFIYQKRINGKLIPLSNVIPDDFFEEKPFILDNLFLFEQNGQLNLFDIDLGEVIYSVDDFLNLSKNENDSLNDGLLSLISQKRGLWFKVGHKLIVYNENYNSEDFTSIFIIDLKEKYKKSIQIQNAYLFNIQVSPNSKYLAFQSVSAKYQQYKCLNQFIIGEKARFTEPPNYRTYLVDIERNEQRLIDSNRFISNETFFAANGYLIIKTENIFDSINIYQSEIHTVNPLDLKKKILYRSKFPLTEFSLADDSSIVFKEHPGSIFKNNIYSKHLDTLFYGLDTIDKFWLNSRFICFLNNKNEFQFFDLTTDKKLTISSNLDNNYFLPYAFSNRNELIGFGDYNSLELYNLEKRYQFIGKYQNHRITFAEEQSSCLHKLSDKLIISNLKDGSITKILNIPENTKIEISPNGTRALLIGEKADSVIKIIDLNNFKITEYNVPFNYQDYYFAIDSLIIFKVNENEIDRINRVNLSDNTLRKSNKFYPVYFDLNNRNFTIHKNFEFKGRLIRNGQFLISINDPNISLINIRTGLVLSDSSTISSSIETIENVFPHPQGETFVVTKRLYNSWSHNFTWELRNKKFTLITKLNIENYTNAVQYSKDGFFIFICCSDTLHVFDSNSGQKLNAIPFEEKISKKYIESRISFKFTFIVSNSYTLYVYDNLTREIVSKQNFKNPIFNLGIDSNNNILFVHTSQGVKILNLTTGKIQYTRLQFQGEDWLLYDEHYRFDGTPGAIDYLYLTCGLEVIDLAQVKDSLWVPGLAEKIMNGEEILINDRPAPKLSDLNICELTPVIEPLEEGDKGLFRYRIVPRNGGLGETEVYINGNLTYKFKPEQLEKKQEQNKDIYYLSISSDSLQAFLTGEKGDANPILVKAKVKGSGIYGRGSVLNIMKQTEQESPKFFGVFIGVNDYGNPSKAASDLRYRDLDYAVKDADDLSKAVEATARNLFNEDCHIYKLTGTGSTENAPTKANIQKALKEIGEQAKASDILYIFFAGHGDIPDGTGDKEIRFILQNADKRNIKSSSFGVDELSEWCHPGRIKAQKRVFVFDACHSGQIINQTMAFNGRGDDDATRIRQLDKLKDKNGMMILAASADNESAYEDETLNQGVLTYHLLQVMKEQQKDTSLVIREWFDETIGLVKEYSRANGNKQEPNSFGDGRFEIGNITDEVRQKIDISCPKTRIGMCVFTDPIGDAEALYPNLREKVNAYFVQTSSRGNLVYSKNMEKAYRIEGSYTIVKNKLQIRYKVYFGDKQQGEAIVLPAIKGKTEEEIVYQLTQSIQREIERADSRDEKCSKR